MTQLRQQMARDLGDPFEPLPTFVVRWGHLLFTFTEATFSGRAAPTRHGRLARPVPGESSRPMPALLTDSLLQAATICSMVLWG
jgi:hypothetical protein